jgi:hypothetical protein
VTRSLGDSAIYHLGASALRRFDASVIHSLDIYPSQPSKLRRFGDSPSRCFGDLKLRSFDVLEPRRLGVSAFRRFGHSALAQPRNLWVSTRASVQKPQRFGVSVFRRFPTFARILRGFSQPPDLSASNLRNSRPSTSGPRAPPDLDSRTSWIYSRVPDRIPFFRQAPYSSVDRLLFHLLIRDAHTRIS